MSPRHRRMILLLCGLLPTLAAAVLSLIRPAALTNLEYAVYDAWSAGRRRVSRAARSSSWTSTRRSLASVGQWPWRRDVIARLVDSLLDRGAAYGGARHHVSGERSVRGTRPVSGRHPVRQPAAGTRDPGLRPVVRTGGRGSAALRPAPARFARRPRPHGSGRRSLLPGNERRLQHPHPDGGRARLRVHERGARSRRHPPPGTAPDAVRGASVSLAVTGRRSVTHRRTRPGAPGCQCEYHFSCSRRTGRAARRKEQSAPALPGGEAHVPVHLRDRCLERAGDPTARFATESSSWGPRRLARARWWQPRSTRCSRASKCRRPWPTISCSATSCIGPNTV